MKEILKSQVREFLKSYPKEFFLKHGFKYKASIDGLPGYIKSTSYGFNNISFNILSTGMTYLLKMNVRHDNVEKIISEVGLPDRPVISANEYTCLDTFTNFSPNQEKSYFYSDNDLGEYCETLIVYMEENGLPFAEKYSNLNNILEKINELLDQKTGWENFIGNGPEYLYRIILISALCKDPSYNDKLAYAEKILTTPNWEPWKPSFDKLKKLLSTY